MLLNLHEGRIDVDDEEFDIRDPSSSIPAITLNCKLTNRDMRLALRVIMLTIE